MTREAGRFSPLKEGHEGDFAPRCFKNWSTLLDNRVFGSLAALACVTVAENRCWIRITAAKIGVRYVYLTVV